jgi:hypothetical protein
MRVLVRSCEKIHEFEAFGWRAYTEEGQGEVLYIVSGENNQPLRDGSNVLAEYKSWDWVRYGDDIDEPESDSAPGHSLAACGDNQAMI